MKKGLALCAALFLVLGLFACGGNKYNAVLYNNAKEWMKADFLKANMTYGAYYKNENYDENDENSLEYLQDKTSPLSRTVIIDDKQIFDEIFDEFPTEIDFNSQTVCLYFFTAYNPRPYILKGVNLDIDTLKINLRQKKSKRLDGIAPTQKCVAVKVDKTNIKTVTFNQR